MYDEKKDKLTRRDPQIPGVEGVLEREEKCHR